MFRRPRYRAPQGRRAGFFSRIFTGGRWLLLLGAVILAVLVIQIRQNLIPILRTMSRHKADLSCTQIINDVVARELEKEDLRYEDLVHLVRGGNEEILAVQTDVTAANRFKAAVSSAIVEELERHALEEESVPLGTLLGKPLLGGHGPKIPFRIVPSQSVATSFSSQFLSAGINQTQHQIMLNISLEADAILSGLQTHVEVETSFLVAETLLVGTVPQTYAEIFAGDRKGILSVK